MAQMYFDDLQRRLLAALRKRLHNGELSERRLAHLTGISQPHVHNVVKGARILSLRATDKILLSLDLTVLDLIERQEATLRLCPECSRSERYVEVPVLEGWLGPGLPLPKQASKVNWYPFPRSSLASVDHGVVARLARDARMDGIFLENDLALLDQSAGKRLRPDGDALYVVNRQGEGVVRRVHLERPDLLLLKGISRDRSECLEALPLRGCHLLDVVKARVTWIGRAL